MPFRSPRPWIALALAALLLAGTAAPLLPGAASAFRLLRAADDPAALSALRLDGVLTPERVGAEIDTAVAAEDEDLARSFLALADAHGVPIEAERRARVAALADGAAYRAARDFAGGAVSGQAEGAAGLAGALAADVSGLGDVRDLLREGVPYLRGEPHDPLLLGLSAVGLAATAATWAGGVGAPARGGLSVLKAARRLGRLPAPLVAALTRMLRAGIDADALRATLKAGARLDLAGLRLGAGAAVRPAALARFRDLGRDVHGLYRAIGSRGVVQVLGLAHTPAEIARAERLAARLGPRTRAVLTLLGRSALVLGGLLATLVQTVLAALAWMLGLALFCRRLGLAIGRAIWPARRAGAPSRDRGLSWSARWDRQRLPWRPVRAAASP